MNRSIIALAVFGTVLAFGLASQPAAAQQGKASAPEVHADGRVTVSLKAPRAGKVDLFSLELVPVIDTMRVVMTMEADSVWRATVGPLPPGIYDYWFELDGLGITDPLGRNAFGHNRGSRDYFEVPGPEGAPRHDERRDVPAGALTIHWYASDATGTRRRLHVYTPPGYLEQPDRTYPVLYLLHGAGDNDAHWFKLGRAHVILDNLIADSAAVPMVVVMPDGIPEVQSEGDGMEYWRQVNDAFTADFLGDVMPFVEARYRVRADREGRAIAGLSLGGGQTMRIGLSNPDHFAWIGAFSSATFWLGPVLDQLAENPEQVNEQLRLFWIAIGKDDFMLAPHTMVVQRLGALGINHEYHETEGYHMWSVWRDYLAKFAPRLWQ